MRARARVSRERMSIQLVCIELGSRFGTKTKQMTRPHMNKSNLHRSVPPELMSCVRSSHLAAAISPSPDLRSIDRHTLESSPFVLSEF